MKAREPELDRRIRNRDAALRRLRRSSWVALAGTAGLAAAFGGLAAKAFPGKSRHTAPPVVQTQAQRATSAAATPAPATPPPLVAAATAAPTAPASPSAPATPPPSPPPAPPVVTPAPPVAVSGGS